VKSFYEHHGFDEYEARDTEDEAGVPRVPRCKFCGSEDVRWRQQGGKWVLFSLMPGIEHRCAERGAPNTDGMAPVEDA
jgi:hypothetical protein